jgi:RNA polymerase sigma-70 factor (ECF subfamily)
VRTTQPDGSFTAEDCRQILDAAQRARAAWPELGLPAATFAPALEARVAEGMEAGGSVEAALAQLELADLYLACACAHGLPAALAELEARCLEPLAPALGRLDPSPAFCDETLQLLRQRLLCADASGTPPRIATYAGRGPLFRWVRAAALRIALNLRRHERSPARRVVERRDLTEVPAGNLDPELALIKARYRPAFKAAFAAAVAGLTSRERNILRLHLLDGLVAEQIGRLYGVHRVSVARWLGQIRASLLEQTRRHLAAALSLSESELDELYGLIESQLELSVSNILRQSQPRLPRDAK